MTDVDLRADAIVGPNAFPVALSGDIHLSLEAPGSQSSPNPANLSCSRRRMTAQKLPDLDRADVKVSELASRLSLEEKVGLQLLIFFSCLLHFCLNFSPSGFVMHADRL